jgi:hypothetical protein
MSRITGAAPGTSAAATGTSGATSAGADPPGATRRVLEEHGPCLDAPSPWREMGGHGRGRAAGAKRAAAGGGAGGGGGGGVG